MKKEIYISTDIESDGPIPGVNSMLSFGSAAFELPKKLISTFSANLIQLPDATTDDSTMDFWNRNPDAWNACRENTIEPKEAMKNYEEWLYNLPGKPVFVGYPAGYDFLFVYWYLIFFNGKSPFSFSALDIKSFAMCKLGTNYRDTTKKRFPKSWFEPGLPHTHVALDDAIEQGHLFCNMISS